MADSSELQRQNELLERILKQREEEADYLLQSEDLTSKMSRNYGKIINALPNLVQYHKDLARATGVEVAKEKEKLKALRSEAIVMGNFVGISKILNNVFADAGESAQKLSNTFSGISSIASDLANRTGVLNKNNEDGITEIDKKYNVLTARLLMLKAVYTGISLALSIGIERFKEIEKSASDFRRETGLLITQTKEYDRIAKDLSLNYGFLGVTLEEARKAQSALVKEFSSGFNITEGIQENVALMQTNLGISVEDTSKLYALFNGMVKSSGETNETLMNLALNLAIAGKIAPKKVFNDIASASSDTLNFFSGMPKKMISVAVEARKAGTTLDSLSKSARGMLNFQESITAEMELSALLGRNVNLQLSREYAWLGENLKAREAALDQLGTLEDFNRMSIFEKEAAARALQIETGEIIKQLGIREQQSAYEAQIRKDLMSGDAAKIDSAKKRKEELQKYLDLQKKSEDSSKKTQEQMSKEYADRIRTNVVMNQFEKLSANIRQIWNGISEPLQNIAYYLLKFINPALEEVGKIISSHWSVGLSVFVGGLVTAYFAMQKLMSLAGSGIGKILAEALKQRKLLEETARGASDAGAPATPGTPAVPTPRRGRRGRPVTPPSPPALPSPTIPHPSTLERTQRSLSMFYRLAGISVILVGLGAGLYLFAKGLKELETIKSWESIGIGLGIFAAGITGLSMASGRLSAASAAIIAALTGLGTQIANPAFWAGIAVFGAIVLTLSGSFYVLGKSAQQITKAIVPAFKVMREAIKGLGEDLKSLSVGFFELGKVGPSLWEAGKAIGLISIAMATLTASDLVSKFINLFSKDPFEKLIEVSKHAADIKTVGESIFKLTESIKVFNELDLSKLKLKIEDFTNLSKEIPLKFNIDDLSNKFKIISEQIKKDFDFISKIDLSDKIKEISSKLKAEIETTAKVSVEISNLNELTGAVNKMVEAVSKLGEMTVQSPQQQKTELDTSRLEDKLDTLIDLMQSGYITATVDIDKLSSKLAPSGRG